VVLIVRGVHGAAERHRKYGSCDSLHHT